MSKINKSDELLGLLSTYNGTFADGFTNRVMDSVDEENSTASSDDMAFYKIYRWVALSGVAAIIVLLFSVYLTEGSFTTDAFFGLVNYNANEPIIASLNY
jgi:hypothetical protein